MSAQNQKFFAPRVPQEAPKAIFRNPGAHKPDLAGERKAQIYWFMLTSCEYQMKINEKKMEATVSQLFTALKHIPCGLPAVSQLSSQISPSYLSQLSLPVIFQLPPSCPSQLSPSSLSQLSLPAVSPCCLPTKPKCFCRLSLPAVFQPSPKRTKLSLPAVSLNISSAFQRSPSRLLTLSPLFTALKDILCGVPAVSQLSTKWLQILSKRTPKWLQNGS